MQVLQKREFRFWTKLLRSHIVTNFVSYLRAEWYESFETFTIDANMYTSLTDTSLMHVWAFVRIMGRQEEAKSETFIEPTNSVIRD